MKTPSRICPACARPMLHADGCNPRTGLRTRREELRFLVDEADWEPFELADRCRDCGATIDGYHHPLCCVAMCFNAHDEGGGMAQRLGCDCDANPATGRPFHTDNRRQR
jgi:hypothetical protein